jgi:acetyltransferase-like isoleucine patch superfamily enzyme
MMSSESNVNPAIIAFSSVPLSLAQAIATDIPAQDVNFRNVGLEDSAIAIGEQIDDTVAIPSELHEPNMPPSLLAAVQAHGFLWLLSVARQAIQARLQLRRCDSMGKWVRVRGRVRVHNEGTIAIADRVRFRSEAAMSELVAWKGGKIEIGEATTINYGTSISAASVVKIGRNCLVGTYVNIMDCNFHNASDHAWNMDAEPVVIEDDVWLGNRCVIMKGVTVGQGSVVAACSLVTKNVPPHTLVVGVPARVVQHL